MRSTVMTIDHTQASSKEVHFGRRNKALGADPSNKTETLFNSTFNLEASHQKPGLRHASMSKTIRLNAESGMSKGLDSK